MSRDGPMRGEVVWFDDFTAGFTRWKQLEEGEFCPNDAVITIDASGLDVVPKGVNPSSGEPAFSQTLAPSPPGKGLLGVLDHVKWLASVEKQSSKGIAGFDISSGKTIHIEALMSGRTYGTERHPFGDAVRDVHCDFRLAAPAMVAMDQETNVVLNFFLTNAAIFALYERPPFARDKFGNYAAFSFAVPVAARAPEDWHKLAISYDRDSNTALWLVDGEVVLEVDRIGRRIERRYMALDVGGEEQTVQLDQLQCGLGMFTLMDASIDGGPGLIDLAGYPFFFCTARGEPHPLQYVDRESLQANRLFGQGARVRCKRFSVSYR